MIRGYFPRPRAIRSLYGNWGAIGILLVALGVLRLAPILDGWHRLAVRYPGGREAAGEVFAFVPARIRGCGIYVRVCVATSGLGIRMRWVMPWHRPFFVPWGDVVRCEPSGLLSGSAKVVCRGAERVPLYLIGRAGRAAIAQWERYHAGAGAPAG